MKKHSLLFIPILLSALAMISCGSKQGKPENEIKFDKEAILQEREDKDNYFATDEDSPIAGEQKSKFAGLEYYEPDEKYYIKAEFIPSVKRDTLDMPTSRENVIKKFIRAGKLKFSINGKECFLTAFLSLTNRETKSFFVPFGDITNGKETDKTGRYLDIDEVPGAKEYILDFNVAYNPLCAYNKTRYSCPVIPGENFLKVAIRAGEKDFKLIE